MLITRPFGSGNAAPAVVGTDGDGRACRKIEEVFDVVDEGGREGDLGSVCLDGFVGVELEGIGVGAVRR
jgi:hypothetical protein